MRFGQGVSASLVTRWLVPYTRLDPHRPWGPSRLPYSRERPWLCANVIPMLRSLVTDRKSRLCAPITDPLSLALQQKGRKRKRTWQLLFDLSSPLTIAFVSRHLGVILSEIFEEIKSLMTHRTCLCLLFQDNCNESRSKATWDDSVDHVDIFTRATDVWGLNHFDWPLPESNVSMKAVKSKHLSRMFFLQIENESSVALYKTRNNLIRNDNLNYWCIYYDWIQQFNSRIWVCY